MNYKKNLKIKEMQFKYQKVLNDQYKYEGKYESAIKKAKCYDCSVYQNDLKKSFSNRHKNCIKCLSNKTVSKAFNEYLINTMKLDEIYVEYAKVIFEVLSIHKPKLVERRTKKVIKWEEAFPLSFSKINNSLRGSLVALIEEDGGAYRIKKTLF